MRRLILVFSALIAAGVPAGASGGLDCTIKDKAVQLTLHSGITRGMGGAFFDFGAEFKTSLPKAPADLKALKFENEHLAQRWLNDKEAKLVLYRERPADARHGYVEITIEAKRINKDDDGLYAGTYALTIYDTAEDGKPEPKPIMARGRVSCSAE